MYSLPNPFPDVNAIGQKCPIIVMVQPASIECIKCHATTNQLCSTIISAQLSVLYPLSYAKHLSFFYLIRDTMWQSQTVFYQTRDLCTYCFYKKRLYGLTL